MLQQYFRAWCSTYPATIYDPMKKDFPTISHASHLESKRGISSKSLQCDFGESFFTPTIFVPPRYRRIRARHVIFCGARDKISSTPFGLNHRIVKMLLRRGVSDDYIN